MSTRFTDYRDAAKEARTLANATGHDVAIRAVREYGTPGYNVKFASPNDSDYALAEIVRPDQSDCDCEQCTRKHEQRFNGQARMTP